MSGGGQEIVYNPSERVISDDANRAQRFRGLDLNELLRALADTNYGTDDLAAASFDVQSAAQLAPVSAAVFGGLVVRPAVGGLAVAVDPGVVGLYDPDAAVNPDESQYKLIRDPGAASGSISMTANSSGQTRVDVVECSRVAGGFSVLETDNRDIFNTVTGLFSAVAVNKVVAGRLQYRVRAGTPGGGFPGAAAGWLPLAVASVPTGTTTNDTVTFWDVRPFVGDRWNAPFNVQSFNPRESTPSTFQIDAATNSAQAIANGFVEATAIDLNIFTLANGGGMYRLGGWLAPAAIDLNLAANRAGSVADGVAYVYLCEPFGLPRWANYSLALTGFRAPINPRGVLLLSNTPPDAPSGCPSSALTLPPQLSGGSVSRAVCVGVTKVTGGQCVSVMTGGRTQIATSPPYPQVNAALISGGALDFPLAVGTNYPPSAKSIRVTIDVEFTFPGGGPNIVNDAPVLSVLNTIAGNSFGSCRLPSRLYANISTSGSPVGPFTVSYEATIPVPTMAVVWDVHLTPGLIAGGAQAVTGGQLNVTGWDL
jgi:hypothetical protein